VSLLLPFSFDFLLASFGFDIVFLLRRNSKPFLFRFLHRKEGISFFIQAPGELPTSTSETPTYSASTSHH
jgi:hypothetical protein